ncbi:MAG: HDOD domain-containing protein [Sulfurimicrobium sp.]|jgi:serine/threonine protein kinase|nr:HDOD domain-containing protein [Sulfurimicrobium sp.]MDZ7654722.1 HDOD domain-containing protein [Sulfurimicrobium sp.]
MSNKGFPASIGRFKILRILGEGAQSVVYLAEDPHLQREVAIKTVHLAGGEDHLARTKTLIDEARTVSKLQHPNIVPIFEAGEHEGNPYLVFEFVQGSDLAHLIRQEGALPAQRAVELTIQILDAVAYAHQHNIIHRDLKPSNILLNAEEIPRVMDFGIATRISEKAGAEKVLMLFGTPGYMAPEYITGKEISPKLDIFATGMILHQMLTGKPAVQGNDPRDTLRLIVQEPIAPPSARNSQVDEKLDDIVLKALAKDPSSRYGSAQDMKTALQTYLTPDEAEPVNSSANQGTLDFLLRRMRHKSDFPALAESISSINRIASSDSEGVTQLSNAILKDVALTSKLLKVVNAAYYNQFGGGTISTVSRAVVILGFDAVRNLALTLMLFDSLQDKEHAAQLKDEFVRSLYSGIIAKGMAGKAGVRNAEEGFICALFHNLGKMLCMFYLMEEVEETNRLMQQKNMSEENASISVLGMSYHELGIGVSKAWNFPEQISHSMRSLPADKIKKPVTDFERLNVLSAFASDICRMATQEEAKEKTRQLFRLTQRFGSPLNINEKTILATAESAALEFAKFVSTLQLDLRQSKLGRQLIKGTTVADTEAKTMATASGMTDAILAESGGATEDEQTRMIELPTGGLHHNAQGILTQGIQDISNSLVEGRSLNDIMRMILETMYTSIGFSRVILCLKDARQNLMIARSGFGPDANEVIKSFRFPMAFAPDVFHVSLKNNVDIIIEDIDDPKIQARIPEWYRKTVKAHTFVLFPISIKNNPIALIYGDRPNAGDIKLPEQELGLLRVLRNQAVLAIKSQT